MSFYIGGFGDGSCPAELSSCYNEVIHYSYSEYDNKSLLPNLRFWNEGKVKKFLSSSFFKNSVNNQTSANSLDYSNVNKGRIYFNEDYSRYDSSYVSYDKQIIWTEDPADIESGKCLLRFNKEKNVIYTIRKTKGFDGRTEYVFRVYLLGSISKPMVELFWHHSVVLKFFLMFHFCVVVSRQV